MKNIPEEKYFCRVCGLKQTTPPWGENNKSPSFEFCVCCGTEFGYNDATLKAVLTQREKWIKSKFVWFKDSLKPKNWDPITQMKDIPNKFK
jgi:hypothetical protein